MWVYLLGLSCVTDCTVKESGKCGFSTFHPSISWLQTVSVAQWLQHLLLVKWIMLNSCGFYCWPGIAQQWGKGGLQDGGNLRLLQARAEMHLCFLLATSVVRLQTAFPKYQHWKGLGFRWATFHTLLINSSPQIPQFPTKKFHFLSSVNFLVYSFFSLPSLSPFPGL